MKFLRIIRLKEKEKDHIQEEIKRLESIGNKLLEEIRQTDIMLEEVDASLKESFTLEGLIKYRSLLSQRERLNKEYLQLSAKVDTLREKLKDIYTYTKKLEILQEKEVENIRKRGTAIDLQNSSYMDLLKRLLFVCVFLPIISFGESALSKKIKEQRENQVNKTLESMTKELELKLKRIEEERKRLESSRQKREEVNKVEDKNLEKLVAIFNKADPDEAGNVMNHMDPNIAAKILLRLKERQAAQILQSMDPQKAAEVSKIMARSKSE